MAYRLKFKSVALSIVCLLFFMSLSWGAIVNASGPTYFVDQSASGLDNGASWDNAFTSLQSALDVAEAGDSIWVAAGVYKPSKRTEEGRARTETFLLIEGVEIYGGFEGDESLLSERDWETHQTILSGDIDDNDSLADGITRSHSDIVGNNAFHVVTGDRTLTYTLATVLDGFVVTGGLTEDARNTNHSEGGGITFQSNASPTLRNLWVVGNESPQDDGGGIHFLNDNDPHLENIVIENNRAGDHGGGLFFENDNEPTLKQITLIHNEADKTASLYMHERNNALLANMNFCGNFNYNSGNPKIGAGFSIESNNTLVVSNAVFAANVNGGTGGGLRMNSNNLIELYHVSMSGNQASDGGAIYMRGSGNDLDLNNSILWGNSSEIVSSGTNTIHVQSSIVGENASPYTGTKNIASEDLPFVLLPSAGNDSVWGTSDDECGDLRLRQSSVAKNAGDQDLIPADVLDLDADFDFAEQLPLDVGLQIRVFGTGVDLGAYEVSTDPITQTITFELPNDADDGMVINEQATLTASATSNLDVEFRSSTPSICTVESGVTTMLAGGVCTIVAEQGGNGDYDSAPEVSRDIYVSDPTKTDQSVSFSFPTNDLEIEVFQSIDIVGFATSGLSPIYSSKTEAVCTVSGTQVNLFQVGTCEVEAIQIGNATFNPSSKERISFNVVKIEQSILLDPLPDTLPADGRVEISATASSGLPVLLSVDSPTVCSIVEKQLSMLQAGQCIVNGNQSGDDFYDAAQAVTHMIDVMLISQSIDFSFPSAGAEYGQGESSELVATASSDLEVSFSVLTPSICEVRDGQLFFLQPGECDVAAEQPGDSRFGAADSIVHQFTVVPTEKDQQSIEIIYPAEDDAFYIGELIVLEAVASSGLKVSFESLTPQTCTIGGSKLITNTTGECKIQATQSGDDGHQTAETQIRTIFVKADQTIRFITSPATHNPQIGDLIPLSATSNSELTVEFESTTPQICQVENRSVLFIDGGLCSVKAYQPGSSQWFEAEPIVVNFEVGFRIYLPLIKK